VIDVVCGGDGLICIQSGVKWLSSRIKKEIVAATY
jgi:hypothetical protein